MLIYLALIDSDSDKDKFEQVYRTYKGLMLSCAYKILRDTSLAEDAVHTAFLRILNNLDKLGEVDDPRTKGFVVIVAENVAKTMYAKQHRMKVVSLEDSLEAPASVEEQSEAKLTAELLSRKIAALPEKYREVMLLRFLHNLSDKEVAASLGISSSAVRKRIERAREKLRREMNL